MCCKNFTVNYLDNIIHHTFQNDLFDPRFISHKSCITQLLTAMEYWTQSVDSGICTDVIYLDTTKALTPSYMPNYYLNLKHIVLEVIF